MKVYKGLIEWYTLDEWEKLYGLPPCECSTVHTTLDMAPPIHQKCGRHIPYEVKEYSE